MEEGKLLAASLPTVAALAYLGDAVHSLDIRRRAVALGLAKSGRLHEFSARIVNAASQAAILAALTPCLSEEERDLCRRAANSKHLQRPKHASDADYRQATAFEALLGMHAYLGNDDRLRELLDASYQCLKGD
ncbi:MAG: ribonuclease III [Clostridia bacterium]|nr:ribonuclease III [Clostridia bacterium]